MTPTTIFSIANALVLPMWLLMLIAPKWKVTNFLTGNKLIPIALSLIYVFYVLTGLFQTGMPDFGSLDSVMQLFTDEKAVLAGWIHYLAFDLLVGMWMLQENKKLGINHLLMAPCLLGAFMFGPLGFLLFMIIKSTKKTQS